MTHLSIATHRCAVCGALYHEPPPVYVCHGQESMLEIPAKRGRLENCRKIIVLGSGESTCCDSPEGHLGPCSSMGVFEQTTEVEPARPAQPQSKPVHVVPPNLFECLACETLCPIDAVCCHGCGVPLGQREGRASGPDRSG